MYFSVSQVPHNGPIKERLRVGDTKILETQNLSIMFGGLAAVDKVSINLKKGEILGLIGTNGAGKTTLFNMVAGALKPSSGKILYKDREIQGKRPDEICKLGIARTYQIVKPFGDLTVIENVMVGALFKHSDLETAREKAKEILVMLGLYERRNVLGKGLNLPELKRMEIARALATEPEILLLDEVMAGLNPTECEKAMNIVRSIHDSGITIIVIEHVMRAIMNISNRIYVLNQGHLIAEGNPAEIANNEEVIKSYLGETGSVKD